MLLLFFLLVSLLRARTPVRKPVYSSVTEGERWNIIKWDYLQINTWMRLAPRAEGPADNRLYLLHQMIHVQTASQQVSSSSAGAPAFEPHADLDSLNDSHKLSLTCSSRQRQLRPTLFPCPTGRWLQQSASGATLQEWISFCQNVMHSGLGLHNVFSQAWTCV